MAEKLIKKRKNSEQVGESETDSGCDNKYLLEKSVVKKRNRYSFEEKQKILEESKKLTSQKICAKYNINDCLLRKWRLKKDEIEDAAKKEGEKTLKRVMKIDDRDAELAVWLNDCYNKGIPVSGRNVCQQALFINDRIGGPKDFKASNGWLEGWKRRVHLKNLNITGEQLSVDVEGAKQYKTKFAELLAEKKLSRSQVFNMEESALMYKSTPKRSFVLADHSQVPGATKRLDRVTIATCCNADGTCLLPLIVIGKSKNPRSLKNLNKNHLPVWYRSHSNAWMNLEIFEEWFRDIFVPGAEAFLMTKKLPLTAILLVDNCRSHKCLKINEIEIHFFPPNVTSLIQPMDQGIIQTLKLHYKKNLVDAITKAQATQVTYFLKTIDLYQVFSWLDDAWQKIKPTTIYRCWNKLWPIEMKDASTPTDECSYRLNNLDMSMDTDVNFTPLSADDCDVKDLLNALKKVDGYELIDVATVLNWIQRTDKVCEEEEEVEEFKFFDINIATNILSGNEFSSAAEVDYDEDENDFDYLASSTKLLYENLNRKLQNSPVSEYKPEAVTLPMDEENDESDLRSAVSAEENDFMYVQQNSIADIKTTLQYPVDPLSDTTSTSYENHNQSHEVQSSNGNPPATQKTDDADFDKMFLLSLLPSFRQIPENMKLHVRIQFQQILVDTLNPKNR